MFLIDGDGDQWKLTIFLVSSWHDNKFLIN
jgi:hypothetical protein